MILPGDSPEGGPYNKFMDHRGDGWRGAIRAISPTGKEAILEANGRLVRVRETDPKKWPVLIGEVGSAPAGWKATAPPTNNWAKVGLVVGVLAFVAWKAVSGAGDGDQPPSPPPPPALAQDDWWNRPVGLRQIATKPPLHRSCLILLEGFR